MKRLRPRTAVLGGAAIGLVAGAVAFGATSSTTVTSPVTKPASFTQQAPVSVPQPPLPVPPKAPCAKNQELKDGVCIVHVERVVVRQQPAPPVQAISQSDSRNDDQAQRSQEPARTSGSPAPERREAEPVEHVAEPAETEAEPRERADSGEHAEAPEQEAAEHQGGQENESED